VFDTKKHCNVKRKAAYRRISKYFKSLDKFKAEKLRRKQVLELHNQGLTIVQVAFRLGVSERTVQRDLKKVMLYVKKVRTQMLRHESLLAVEQFQAMGLKQQVECAVEYEQEKRRLRRPRRCRSLHVTIDLDDALTGKYALRYKPKLPVEMRENGKITIELSAHGKKQKVARIYLGKVAWETVNIDTNRSLHTVTPFTLKGLQIVEELP